MVKHHGFALTDFKMERKPYNDILAKDDVTYLILGLENCPSTGRLHWQGFIYFTNDRTVNSVRKKLPNIGYVQAMYYKSWPKRAANYCAKNENLVMEVGECPSQGKRKDLNSIKLMVKNGDDLYKVIDECDNLQQIQYAEKLFKYRNLQMKRPIKKIDIIWIMGPPGSGKSRIVHELEDDLYQPITAKWWDGYNGQKAVLLDDFRSNWCDYNYFLRLTDMYPLTVEVKGGSYPAMWDKVYITCPHSPEKTFRYIESIEDNKQVLRRITAQFDLNTMSWDMVLSQLRGDKNGAEVP